MLVRRVLFVPTTVATSPAFPVWRCPQPLVEQFAAVFAVSQQELARLMRLAAGMAAALPEHQREFVADDLALVMNVHPRTAVTFTHRAVAADRLGLLAAMEAGELTDRHLAAVIDEVERWAPDDETMQAQVVARVLDWLRTRLGVDGVRPAPAELARRVRAVALLLDLTAAEKAKKTAAERRDVSCFQSAVGEGTLTITGPEVQTVAMMAAVRARAEAYGRLPGDTRTLAQRMHDACFDLLMVDADGGESSVPALDVTGVPTTIRVRGIEIAVLMPYSVTQGGDLELAEIPGFGPLLPSTAREVLGQADHLRQIAVDAATGEVLAVEDRIPVHHPDPDPAAVITADDPEPDRAAQLEPEPEPDVVGEPEVDEPCDQASPTPATPVAVDEPTDPAEEAAPACAVPTSAPTTDSVMELALALMANRPLRFLGPQHNNGYRIASRVLRAVRARDRTCCFPGCTTPARWTDADHRDPWPKGPSSTGNVHCLCRRHHRAKQAYFTVEVDDTGHTVWTTPDGRRYRRPPPRY